MEQYKTRPGVVLTQICGEYLLVAAKAARSECPYYSFLNESSAFVWRLLEQGADLAALESAVSEEYEMGDPAEVRQILLRLLEELEKNHYLLRTEQGGKHEE